MIFEHQKFVNYYSEKLASPFVLKVSSFGILCKYKRWTWWQISLDLQSCFSATLFSGIVDDLLKILVSVKVCFCCESNVVMDITKGSGSALRY